MNGDDNYSSASFFNPAFNNMTRSMAVSAFNLGITAQPADNIAASANLVKITFDDLRPWQKEVVS